MLLASLLLCAGTSLLSRVLLSDTVFHSYLHTYCSQYDQVFVWPCWHLTLSSMVTFSKVKYTSATHKLWHETAVTCTEVCRDYQQEYSFSKKESKVKCMDLVSCLLCYVFQIISAVQYCHQKNIVHRDLKVSHTFQWFLWNCSVEGTVGKLIVQLYKSFH